jgi:16S rRNA (cytidine1402-2'-O)-methyltransferase
MLYIVATPIGNLGDITLRAIEMLTACDFVIAENPRYSQRLLQHIHAWPKETVQFAEHNEQQILKDLTRRLGKDNGCLITDAGTPGISDPGFRLVRECVKENVQVVPIPGASAAIAALCASGLPTDKFLFLGFLQKTAVKTVGALQAAATAEATAIFYESPERMIKTLNYIANAFPGSQVAAAREITKMHEEFIRGTPGEVLDKLRNKTSIKGEFVVLVSFK